MSDSLDTWATSHDGLYRWIETKKVTVKNLIVRVRRGDAPQGDQMYQLEVLLARLQGPVMMTKKLLGATRIDQTLAFVAAPENKFPAQHLVAAQDLITTWKKQKEAWDAIAAQSTSASTSASAGQTAARSSSSSSIEVSWPPPPTDHPIFGLHGIMHGMTINESKRISYVLDVRYSKKDFKVFGDNGIEVGAWWPMQSVALFNGAHGRSQGGISGSTSEGAYSVVVSGRYEGLDQDLGDIIYYSGSQAHENTNESIPDQSRDNETLFKSIQTGRPVRVLRSSRVGSQWAPAMGYRYDGLYNVVEEKDKLNSIGGAYQQFKLVRLDGQKSLEQIRLSSPTAKQRSDFGEIKNLY